MRGSTLLDFGVSLTNHLRHARRCPPDFQRRGLIKRFRFSSDGKRSRAIRDNPVIVLTGETGSGRRRSFLKYACRSGEARPRHDYAHAASTTRRSRAAVATRLAEELGVPLGGAVGVKVRFGDRTSDRTVLKLMTDGILLAEIQNDPDLRAYDTIIIDECTERSLNIDFLLGYLKQLLPRRRTCE